MAEDYMSDGGDSAPQKEDSGNKPKTALLPTDFFGGKELQPGTECKVRIEAVHDGQVEVSYESEDSEPDQGDTGEMGEGEAPMPAEMSGMME